MGALIKRSGFSFERCLNIIFAGCDEAGRGCVIGSMVIGIFAADSDWDSQLREMGVKDSKDISPARREVLAEKLRKIGKHVLVRISAEELTELMTKGISLNEIEAIKIADGLAVLQGELALKHNEFSKVFVDSPDPIPSKFEQRIRKYLKIKGADKIKFVCENKAENKFPCVAAASILAKVDRDSLLEEIKKKVGTNFGSGYSSDPVTAQYVREHHADPILQPFLRHRWETVKRLKSAQVDLTKYF